MKYSESDTAQTQEEDQSLFSSIAPGEVVIGTLLEVDEQGQPFVDFPGNASKQSLKAITTFGLTQANVGRQLALLFANGNLNTPVIVGLIHSPLQDMLESFGQSQEDKKGQEGDRIVDEVLVDGEKIVFEAKDEIVLKCGESSITLSKSGKIQIRGKQLLNRSSGLNRIMGGSVQIN